MISADFHTALGRPRPIGLAWAFFERQINLWKRYWCWELVWLVYGVVNTLAITFIAEQVGQDSIVGRNEINRLVMFLLIGTLVWAYLSAVLDDVSLVVGWERWEGTIEHTLMAPVPRVIHLLGMSVFGVAHAVLRTVLIFALAAPFFDINVANADWLAAFAVIAVGSVSVIGLAILAGILPLLYPERGPQMSFMVQAVVLLVSGVYYSVDVLPGWLQAVSYLSPATYMLDGIRGAMLDGQGIGEMTRILVMLLVFGVLLVPLSVAAFALAEKWAKITGRLKRHG
ncbi:MAG: ABC transporter permease [Dehalococcoidia bacterium]|nr:ABC transporter permease [Dehalococcoidia bacterium]